MPRSCPWFATLAFALLLTSFQSADAAPFRPLARPYGPRYFPNRMPGWDWARIYPWSPYNYGRNPYNPFIVPYQYPYVYSYPYAYSYPSSPYVPYLSSTTATPAIDDETVEDGTMFPSHRGQNVLMPFPTGEIKTAPRDAGVIVVRVPTTFTKVLFDGQPTYTTGTKRYFVTPSLTADKFYYYTMTVSWEQDGRPVTKERTVAVQAGTTTVLDFSPK
jgi:uncharacterized protein (TIGR03000 family)